MTNRDDLLYGPVIVTDGPHKGMVVEYDDDDDAGAPICYIGSIHESIGGILVAYEEIRAVTTADLIGRRNEIDLTIAKRQETPISDRDHLILFYEYQYIKDHLRQRWDVARGGVSDEDSKRIFISHSSKDKQTATWISVDLANLNHRPWLDEWEIKVGESIPKKISDGIDDCDFVLILLSRSSVESGWVEREWQAKYWEEIESDSVKVLPALLEPCEVPALLRMKCYADLRKSYNDGFERLAKSLL